MANYTLLTASGSDRPGIVAAITGVLYDTGCNIEDSQMARLGPCFACMLMIRMPEGLVSGQLAERLAPTSREWNLQVHLTDLLPEEAVESRPDGAMHLIRVEGADRKGIVHRITRHLAEHSVNITNLHTEVIHQETPLYVMTLSTEIPPFVDADRLRAELESIGRSIEVHVSMSAGR